MTNNIFKLLMVVLVALSVLGCQGEETSPPTPTVQQPAAAKVDSPKAVTTTAEQPVKVEASVEEVQQPLEVVNSVPVVAEPVTIEESSQPAVDLTLSDGFLKQIDADAEDEFLTQLPPQGEDEAAEKRKVKISGGVLLDADNEVLVDKVDGGKVNISIPLN
ncbi:hypothetical protein SAMN05660420_03037 [Desulfuromusa kysingii]|uniref:Uncharacterized protein n=1 Tax=Desulfuromusa kysingii TaxID=37625 RepID=A0A1H4DPZ7_9BACT|nr:hypothetical protein [Desulfuromusa kysingii]SEA74596.1 hypothetical protein SAMN05660420_03037 [Desulfuromusa kysingii]